MAIDPDFSNINHSRILLVFPHNFADQGNGVKKRFFELVRYLNQRGFVVDFLGLKNFKSQWPLDLENHGLPGIQHCFLYDHSTGLKKAYFQNMIRGRFSRNRNLLGKVLTHLPDYVFPGLQKLFNKIIRERSYDYILISYVQWANLLIGNELFSGKKVLTMEDCISRNIAENHMGPLPMAKLLEEEAERVNLFDSVISLSWNEMAYFAANTTKPTFHYVPVFMEPRYPGKDSTKEYDILFIGSDNPSNQKGIRWFFDFVYPLLKKETSILCVGKITSIIPDLENVKKIGFIADLQEVYQKAAVTINPLQDGTGMKVKVIESLAHGIPVVTTAIGLSGIKPEVRQLFIIADEPHEFAFAIHRLITDKKHYLDYCQVMNKVFNDNFATTVAARELDKIFRIPRNTV